jgi:hypothetical protein
MCLQADEQFKQTYNDAVMQYMAKAVHGMACCSWSKSFKHAFYTAKHLHWMFTFLIVALCTINDFALIPGLTLVGYLRASLAPPDL